MTNRERREAFLGWLVEHEDHQWHQISKDTFGGALVFTCSCGDEKRLEPAEADVV